MLWHQSFFVGGVILKKIKYFFPFLFLFIFIFSLTVNAEDKPLSYATVDITNGETFYYYFEWENGTEYQYQLADEMVYTGSKKLALYIGGGDYPMWIRSNDTNVNIPSFRSYTSMETCTSYGSWPIGNGTSLTTLVPGKFETNIPVFESADLATQYSNGTIGIEKALNYKKTYENGSWVKPFEDIDINDREIPVPELCNITHSSFSVSNNVDEKYLVEVYLDSGLQNPYYALDAMTYNSIDDPFYVNSFGLITDRSEAYWNGPDFDVFALWQVDNRSALLESVNSFYTRFPTAMSWYTAEDVQTTGVMSHFDKTAYGIWGAPFGDKYGLWGNISKVTAEDLAAVDIDDVPLCFTHYRVRYWYYDDDSGYHYGPWASVVYFSDGKVVINSIFQDDDGNIIESGTESGRQDGNGILNITDKFGSLDLGSSDNLFAYINSLFTNLKYVAGNYSIVFASVFSFLPEDVRHMIYLGMGAIIVIAIIKALRG